MTKRVRRLIGGSSMVPGSVEHQTGRSWNQGGSSDKYPPGDFQPPAESGANQAPARARIRRSGVAGYAQAFLLTRRSAPPHRNVRPPGDGTVMIRPQEFLLGSA